MVKNVLKRSSANKHGSPLLHKVFNKLSSRITRLQMGLLVFLSLYVGRNFSILAGLDHSEPLANLYSTSFLRATWITTALDAGFWSAMTIERKQLREICEVLFSLYYLCAPEQADEKVYLKCVYAVQAAYWANRFEMSDAQG